MQKALEVRGFEVELAGSGDAGLELIRSKSFDIVGLDHHMPGHSGLEVLQKIRELADAPPVVYVTGSEDSKVAVAALKAGAVDYVWKDVQGHFRELLVEAVLTALEKQRLHRDKEAADREVIAARDRAELLLREVNHRVANSLSIVAGLARMHRSTVSDGPARQVLDDMQARILAVAGVHKRLYTSPDVQTVEIAAYLEGLVEDLNGALRASGGNHNIVLRAEPINLVPDKAVSLGIIVTELVTNAYKYAYADKEAAKFAFASPARACTGSLPSRMTAWAGRAQEAVLGTGPGARVINSMSTRLGGELAYQLVSQGTTAVLKFDL